MSAEIPAQAEECQLEGRLVELDLRMQNLISEERQTRASLKAIRHRHDNDQIRFSLNGQLGHATAVTAVLLYLCVVFQAPLIVILMLAAALIACLACYHLAMKSRKLLASSEEAFEQGSLNRENLMQELAGETSRIEAILHCLQKERERMQHEEEESLKALVPQPENPAAANGHEAPL